MAKRNVLQFLLDDDDKILCKLFANVRENPLSGIRLKIVLISRPPSAKEFWKKVVIRFSFRNFISLVRAGKHVFLCERQFI